MSDTGGRAPIPITVIGGALGAGKTTLVNALLSRSDRRLGIVVNDFGDLGVDAESVAQNARVSHQGAEVPVVNLANGCVCCTLGEDLGVTLAALAGVTPPLDHIVIEASGVADPHAAAAWATVPGFVPSGVIVVAAADSVRRSSTDRYVGGEVTRQLVAADMIVLTKSDRCQAEQVTAVLAWLSSISAAPVVEAVSGDVEVDVVLGQVSRGDGVFDADHGDGGKFGRWSVRLAAPVERARLDGFLGALPLTVLRMKGFVGLFSVDGPGTVLVQVVGRNIAVEPAERVVDYGLEAIFARDSLDVTELDALAGRHLLS